MSLTKLFVFQIAHIVVFISEKQHYIIIEIDVLSNKSHVSHTVDYRFDAKGL